MLHSAHTLSNIPILIYIQLQSVTIAIQKEYKIDLRREKKITATAPQVTLKKNLQNDVSDRR